MRKQARKHLVQEKSLTQLVILLWLLVEVDSVVLDKGSAFRVVIAVRAVIVDWGVAVYYIVVGVIKENK